MGYGTRFSVAENDLPPGWHFERRGPKYTVWFDDQGKPYRSSNDVNLALITRGLLHLLLVFALMVTTSGLTTYWECT